MHRYGRCVSSFIRILTNSATIKFKIDEAGAMTIDLPNSVRPLANICLQIREDLVFTPQYSQGRIAYYIVEDTLTSRFFRLGIAEHCLARQMNGRTTISAALKKLSVETSKHQLTEDDAIGFCHWLVEMDLAQSQSSSTVEHLVRRAESIDKAHRQSRLNPLGLRFQLLRPNRLLDRMLVYCGWMFSKWCFGIWALVVYCGMLCIAADWHRFKDASAVLLSMENSGWLFGCWICLKLIHETAHGLVCKRFGGSVREAGLQCVWFVPMPYVDVTSCWKFASRWPRILVAIAGIYAEFGIAAIAAIIWAKTESGILNHLAYNVVVMASLATFLFNANPLMKLDGYYVLSDIFAIPNLYQHGQRRVQGWFDRTVLGLPTTEPRMEVAKSCFVLAYGWLSFLWRVGLSIGLTVAMARCAGQAGPWVALIVAFLWMGPGFRQFAKSFIWGRPGIPPRRFRVVAIASFAMLTTGCMLAWLPWPGRIEAPAIVEYSRPVKLRAAGSGQVVAVHVASGQFVEQDELLLSLENHELLAKVASLRLQIQQIEIRERRFQQKSQLALKQAEEEQRQALKIELDAKEAELAELQVRAPHPGIVDHPDLHSLQGRFLKAGDEIMRIAAESDKELRVAIEQQDFDHYAHQVGVTIRINIPGLPIMKGHLKEIVPRASLTPLDPALASVYGGSLLVRSKRDRKEDSSHERQDESYELLSPCLEGIVSIGSEVSSQLRSGQRATVSLCGRSESIGEHLYRLIDGEIRDISLIAGIRMSFSEQITK